MPDAPPSPRRLWRRSGRSAWLDVDWPAHQRWLEVDGTPANVVELGAGPPLLLVHGLSGCWQNWLENIPHFARTHRVIAVDLPASAPRRCRARRSRSPATRASSSGVCDALSIDAAAVVGNSMGGHVASELAIASPQRVERLMLVSAAGISAEQVQRDAVMTGGRVVAAIATRPPRSTSCTRAGPGCARVALSFVVRHPERLSAPLAHELMQGAGKPGFLPALEAILDAPHQRAAAADRLPDVRRVGRGRPRDPGARRETLRAS